MRRSRLARGETGGTARVQLVRGRTAARRSQISRRRAAQATASIGVCTSRTSQTRRMRRRTVRSLTPMRSAIAVRGTPLATIASRRRSCARTFASRGGELRDTIVILISGSIRELHRFNCALNRFNAFLQATSPLRRCQRSFGPWVLERPLSRHQWPIPVTSLARSRCTKGS